MELITMFVIMQRNGTYDDQRSIPIRICTDSRDADHLAKCKNECAASLAGKILARDLMLQHYRSTHHHHVDSDVAILAHREENDRLTSILGIQADCEALGFGNEHVIDDPFWSVVPVIHGGIV